MRVWHLWENFKLGNVFECFILDEVRWLELFESLVGFLEEADRSVVFVRLDARGPNEVCDFDLRKDLVFLFWLGELCVDLAIEFVDFIESFEDFISTHQKWCESIENGMFSLFNHI